MNARRPFQPLPTQSANVSSVPNGFPSKRQQDSDTQNSDLSGLTSLDSNAADDEFERLMIQNARDERRLRDTLGGKVQPFRKARPHPRVGLTLENLERHEEDVEGGATRGRGPSSTSSGTSDPAVRPPVEWGRKARVRKNWLRNITNDGEQEADVQEEVVDQLAGTTPRPADYWMRDTAADIPRPSIEDSPLSRKSSHQGTPTSTRRRNASFEKAPDMDLDFSMDIDFNEASMIVSTPYVPRNRALDDIRQREIESLKEQAVATNTLDKIREKSPEETRRPREASRGTEQALQGASTAEPRRRSSPILVYKKSAETIGIVDPGLSARGQTSPEVPARKKEDHHNLLRRLARASSNTPSPGRTTEERPEPAPTRQDSLSPRRRAERTQSTGRAADTERPETQSPRTDSPQEPPKTESAPPKQQPQPIDVDATPMPVERSILSAKTPRVTGAWIDTPGPATVRRTNEEPAQLPSPPPERGSPSHKREAPQGQDRKQQPLAPAEKPRPVRPRSALEAIVEDAKANGSARRHEDQLGDSTIDSLEDLINPENEDRGEGTADEDTLQGLQLPTEPPKNEAERLRQKELAQLHKMNQRLRAARTSIRDASRGMRKVEHQVEHIEEDRGASAHTARITCPCATNGHQGPWTKCKRLFYRPESSRSYGLTWLSIALIALLVWFISECLACDQYCHKMYAPRMKGFGVDDDAPQFPLVIPTMLYRNFQRPWKLLLWPFRLLWALITWLGALMAESLSDTETKTLRQGATSMIRRLTTSVVQQTQETFEPDLEDFGFDDDEII